jgi:hypothetical protein
VTRRAIVRQADVKRAVRGVIEAGLTVTGVHIDGSVIKVLTDAATTEPGMAGNALGSESIKEALRKAKADLAQKKGPRQP